jgi:hypothetical protein
VLVAGQKNYIMFDLAVPISTGTQMITNLSFPSRRGFLGGLISLFLAFPICAQVTTGSISGYVLDPNHKGIANAKLVARDASHGFERQAVTDASGFYTLTELAPSTYEVSASADGFAEATARETRVEVNSRVRLDVGLAIAGRAEKVEVRAQAQALASESSELGEVIDQTRIQELPLNQRDFLQLALLAPGVLPAVQDSQLSQRGGIAFHANGGREESNNFLIDGADNNDPYERAYVLEPPIDSIQEFKIATNNYSAEYGRGAGGQINLITRSGTNNWHGSAYEYLRNRVFDARNFFDGAESPGYIRNQFGAGVGGPLIHDRTFFFVNLDGLRSHQGLTQLATVPTPQERAWNLSALGSPVVDPFTGTPFPGNVIPPSRISPVAQDILKLYPLPDLAGGVGNYLAQPIQTENTWQFTGRLDHHFSPNNVVTARYSFGNQSLFEPYTSTSDGLPGFGDFVTNTGQNIMLQYERILGPRTVNSLRLGLNHYFHQVLQQNHATNVAALWGVPWLDLRPQDLGYPVITVTGLSPVGDATALPLSQHSSTWQIADGIEMVRGSHGIKIGAEFRDTQLNAILDYYTRGSLSFLGAISGSGISDLLLGFPTFGLQSQSDNPQALRTAAYNAYVQDDWKIARRLTLNLGLRYEYDTPPVDPTNHMSILDLATQQIVQVGTHGISRSGLRPDYDEFAPRVGFAWTPAEKLVVRGGYGIYYDSGMLVVNSSLYFNPPYFSLQLALPTATSLPSLSNPFSKGIPAAPSPNTLSPGLTNGYVQNWNLDMQRELSSSTVLSVAYSGSKGTHLIRSLDLNQPAPGPGELSTRRPYPDFGSIFFTESGGNSNFNALEASVNRRLSHRFSLLASYTYSKSIDDTSAFLGTISDKNFPQNSHDRRAERALSSFDMRQRFTAAYSYSLPGRALWNKNFELRGIAAAQSGQPMTPILLADNSNTGNTGGIFGSDRPNVVGDPHLSNPTVKEWFNTAAFAVAPPYQFGNAGRNIFTGPGLFNFDLALSRRFRIREGMSVQFDVESFNLFNRANFNLPQLYVDDSATFGRIFSAQAPRQIQFALRTTW